MTNTASTIVTNTVSRNLTNTVSINFDDKKVGYEMNYYILHTFLLVVILLFIIVIICKGQNKKYGRINNIKMESDEF